MGFQENCSFPVVWAPRSRCDMKTTNRRGTSTAASPTTTLSRRRRPDRSQRMLQKKICMLGSFSVGKTSLVRRFVESIFDEKYQTTIGVKVDKKVTRAGGEPVTLVLWDIYGEDVFQKMRMTYLRGMAGYLLVVDPTRNQTLDDALALQARVQE